MVCTKPPPCAGPHQSDCFGMLFSFGMWFKVCSRMLYMVYTQVIPWSDSDRVGAERAHSETWHLLIWYWTCWTTAQEDFLQDQQVLLVLLVLLEVCARSSDPLGMQVRSGMLCVFVRIYERSGFLCFFFVLLLYFKSILSYSRFAHFYLPFAS